MVGITGLYSCSDDFKVAAPYKNITFAYSILDMRDTAQYVRIQKAFLDDNKSAIEMAQVADSSFYRNVRVRLKGISGNNVVTNDSMWLVDLNQEGITKDGGTFFSGPSWGYKTKRALDPNLQYRLVINVPDAGVSDSAQIQVLNRNSFQVPLFTDGNYKVKFDKTVPSGTPQASFKFSTIVPMGSAMCEGYLRFHYVERTATTEVAKFVDFQMLPDQALSRATNFEFNIANSTFFSFLRNEMGIAPAGTTRYMDSVDFYVYVGGENLKAYQDAQRLSTGLTGDQIKPIYSSFSTRDFYGLFSSRAFTFKTGIPLDSATVDSLKVNPVTEPLKIMGFTGR